jgi:hypothetical protein
VEYGVQLRNYEQFLNCLGGLHQIDLPALVTEFGQDSYQDSDPTTIDVTHPRNIDDTGPQTVKNGGIHFVENICAIVLANKVAGKTLSFTSCSNFITGGC